MSLFSAFDFFLLLSQIKQTKELFFFFYSLRSPTCFLEQTSAHMTVICKELSASRVNGRPSPYRSMNKPQQELKGPFLCILSNSVI